MASFKRRVAILAEKPLLLAMELVDCVGRALGAEALSDWANETWARHMDRRDRRLNGST